MTGGRKKKRAGENKTNVQRKWQQEKKWPSNKTEEPWKQINLSGGPRRSR